MSKMISLTEDGAFLASDNISAPEYINITMMAQLNMFNNLVAQGAPATELYDLYNEAASAFLSTFIPDKELRPDLTEEAILAKENELLNKQAMKIDALTPKQKKVEQLKNEHRNKVSPLYAVPLPAVDQADPDVLKKIEEAGE